MRQKITRGGAPTMAARSMRKLWDGTSSRPARKGRQALDARNPPPMPSHGTTMLAKLPDVLSATSTCARSTGRPRTLSTTPLGGASKSSRLAGLNWRGALTLEGLCTSYFVRTTKMYDTLMQMGRWFGYRPGIP